MDEKVSNPNIEQLDIEACTHTAEQSHFRLSLIRKYLLPILGRFHAGYFRISLSLCSQALLWKILGNTTHDPHTFRQWFRLLPSAVFILLWCLNFLTLLFLSLLYILRCFFCFNKVKGEFLHHVGVNYLFAPWICWLLLLQTSPFVSPQSSLYLILWWVFITPIVVLDVKIYGQYFTKGKRFLSGVANPTSQLSVIANLVGAHAAAQMGWKESAICLFSLGMSHYLVLFVTLYQRLSGSNGVPTMLRPVFFLFFAAPSMASLSWESITGEFDNMSKMLFFLSLFLFLSLVSRPLLFKRSMKKFNIAWWAYSYPLTILALASAEYAEDVKGHTAHIVMLLLSAFSILVSLALLAVTAIKSNYILLGTRDVIPKETCGKNRNTASVDGVYNVTT